MQLAAYISKFAANLSGSFGYVVTSKQCVASKTSQMIKKKAFYNIDVE